MDVFIDFLKGKCHILIQLTVYCFCLIHQLNASIVAPITLPQAVPVSSFQFNLPPSNPAPTVVGAIPPLPTSLAINSFVPIAPIQSSLPTLAIPNAIPIIANPAIVPIKPLPTPIPLQPIPLQPIPLQPIPLQPIPLQPIPLQPINLQPIPSIIPAQPIVITPLQPAPLNPNNIGMPTGSMPLPPGPDLSSMVTGIKPNFDSTTEHSKISQPIKIIYGKRSKPSALQYAPASTVSADNAPMPYQCPGTY